MGQLTATMVVDLKDRTGNTTQAIIGNLDRLKRAERDRMLAERGTSLNRVQRAQEREMIAREAAAAEALQKRNASIATYAARGAFVAGAAAVAAGRAYTNFADLERRVNRIVINADKGAEAIRPVMADLQKVAGDTHVAFDEVVAGFETLIASGRSLEESLAFLPSVALTAQASGAAMSDIALSADAMAGSLKIHSGEMQKAFDILVAGGKAGKFELKDMSQYLPSLLPAFAALGYEGTEGLQKVVAMLQVMRNQAGSSSEAATYLSNVLNKMYSEETAKKFSKFGVDLPKALDKAKKEGKDVLDVFLDMTAIATKGDLSKLTRLFTDSEMQKGVRALLTQRDTLRHLTGELSRVDGTALKDFNQIADDSAAKIQNLANLWDKFTTQVGAGIAAVVNPALGAATDQIDDAGARRRGIDQLGGAKEALKDESLFHQTYRKQNPDAWYWERAAAWDEALAKLGRGEIKSVFEEFDRQAARSRGGERTGQYPSRGSYDPTMVDEERRKRSEANRGQIPVPIARPTDEQRRRGPISSYPSRGSYGADVADRVAEYDDARRRREAAEMHRRVAATLALEGARGAQSLGLGGSTDRLPGKTADDYGVTTAKGAQEVTLSGTPSVMATITNPPPRPNINVKMDVVINEAANAEQVAQMLSQRVQQEMNGLHASTSDSGL